MLNIGTLYCKVPIKYIPLQKNDSFSLSLQTFFTNLW